MRRRPGWTAVGWGLIALVLTGSAGCAGIVAGPPDPMTMQGTPIWDCGWRML